MQTVICKVRNCGFCSQHGFCLNRLTVINEQGVCKYLTTPGWDQPVEDYLKNTYTPPEKDTETQASLPLEACEKQKQDGLPRD